jgi:hypothetical protein
MKSLTKNMIVTIACILVLLILGCGKDRDFITFTPDLKGASYNVAMAGTLTTLLGDNKNTIENLTLTGELNGNDIYCIREIPNLSVLDLSGTSIVSGGDAYFYGYPGYVTSNDASYTTTDNVIGNNMFHQLTKLKSIILPNNTTSIGNGAFYYCTGLTSIIIPNNVMSIGSNAFYYCTGLTSVTIGSSVTSIGSSAFGFCSQLAEVHVKATIPLLISDSNIFSYTPSTKKLYVPAGYKSSYQSSRWGSYFYAVNIIEE